MAYTLSQSTDAKRLIFANGDRSIELHPIWLRERTSEEGAIDPNSKQRLYSPAAIDPDLAVLDLATSELGTTITWSDDHVQQVGHADLANELGWVETQWSLPTQVPWGSEPTPFPRFGWPALDDGVALLEILSAFFTHGFVVMTNTPTEAGSLEHIASRFGPVRATNFGLLFDVFSKPKPVDLAYTPIELKAHTDNPYRNPVPSIQFLHCLVNDATGGESTLVDGFAAANDLEALDSNGHRALTQTMVTYRYQFQDELIEGRAPILETDRDGNFEGIRNSDRLDFVDPVDPADLDIFYRGRAELRKLLNDPARRATFLLSAGDVMMMNNRRLLHGRNSFELTTGMRHLQGCYIEFDGPEMLYRKLNTASS